MRTIELMCHVGCYVGYHKYKLNLTIPDEMSSDEARDMLESKYLYWEAMEICDDYYGLHGFETEMGDDEFEEDPEEAIRMFKDEHAEYYTEIWNEEEHAPYCTYGANDLDSRDLTFH